MIRACAYLYLSLLLIACNDSSAPRSTTPASDPPGTESPAPVPEAADPAAPPDDPTAGAAADDDQPARPAATGDEDQPAATGDEDQPAAADTAPPDADELEAEMEDAFTKGMYGAAFRSCRNLYKRRPDPDLAAKCGVAACKARRGKDARRYYDKLEGSRKTLVYKLCEKEGVILPER